MSQRQPNRGEPGVGTLFVVATPIGNLEDMTLRAIRILKEVAVVAAEDTRRTRNLLRHFDIDTPLLSLHEHNERRRSKAILDRLAAGESVAYVTDAGTPGVADPGAVLVQAVRSAGFSVTPIPGPSAVTAAVSAAGLPSDGFRFVGFPPNRSNARRRWVRRLLADRRTALVMFEAPHRVGALLEELATILGKCHITVARELTKLHEEWYCGEPATVARTIGEPLGEFVVIIPPGESNDEDRPIPPDAEIAAVFGQITESDPGSRRQALKATAQRLGIPVNHVYSALERHRDSVK